MARNAIALVLAIGLGFGIGEIWFLAVTLFVSPGYPDLPFWQFGPFLTERLEVCFLHSVFVLMPIVCLTLRYPVRLGGLAGMLLHFLANFPIYLAQIDLFAIGRPAWQQALTLWIVAFVVAGAVVMKVLHCKFKRLSDGETAA